MNALESEFTGSIPGGDGNRGGGASVSLWNRGREVRTLCGGECDESGRRWSAETLVPIYSATKVPAAACLLLALYDCCQTPDLEVGDLWPAFPAPHCTVAEVLSHQAGLAALEVEASLFDLDACRAAIEKTTPQWSPPCHGYHPHTYGPILDVLMLELTGRRVGSFWEERVRAPLSLDLYIGLPEDQYDRVAMLRRAKVHGKMPETPFYRQFFSPSSQVYRAFHSVRGGETPGEMNTPEMWSCASPAKGGVASARGLAMFYQALMGYLPGSPFPVEVLRWMQTPQIFGEDLTLMESTGFTCGAMYAPGSLFGRGGFGHAGAGGSHAFCEPSSGRSFAYVTNMMEVGVLPGSRVMNLIRAADEEI